MNDKEFKDSYFVANRDIGWIRGGLTVTATWTWAIALLVPSQKAFEQGFAGAFWYLIPSVATLFIYCFFLAKVDEKFLDNYTLPQLMKKRWGNRVHALYSGILAALQIMCYSINIIAGAKLICSLLDISYLTCTVIIGAFVLLYTMNGGFKSSVTTDVIQTIIMCMGSVLIVALIWSNLRGSEVSIMEMLKSGTTGFENKAFDTLFSKESKLVFLSFGLTSVLGLITGPFGDQMYWQRAFAIRKEQRNKAFGLAAILFTIIPLAMIYLGFLAAAEVQRGSLNINDPANVAIEFIYYHMPAFSTLFFVIMVGAAITSTMDSCLCAFSSIVANDLLGGSKKNIHRISYGSMIFLVICSVIIANIPNMQTLYLFMFYTVIRMCTFFPTVLTCLKKDKYLSEKVIFWGILSSLMLATPIYAYASYVGNAVLTFIGTLMSIAFPVLFMGIYYFKSKREVCNNVLETESR